MTTYKPVNPESFGHLTWRSPSHYKHATGMGHVTLSPREVYRAAALMPVAFVKKGQRFDPVAVAGQTADHNLFIGPDGRWLVRYVPAALRLQPFKVIPSGKGDAILCADVESAWVSPSGGNPFFEGDGAAPAVQPILAELTQMLSESGPPLKAISDALQEHSLLTPWDITFIRPDGTQVAHKGLYHIDADVLGKLTGAALEALHRVHALPMIYAQRLSTFHLPLLDRLARMHGQLAPAPTTGLDSVDNLFGESSDDIIKFGFDAPPKP
ncbi:SapC family protein [Alcaligenaceae bacterium]|nr:SapC family protein [Alcaligenaceae bacterium]